MIEYVAGAAVGGAFFMWLYKGISGCTNGHVWGEWEATRRWRSLPWEYNHDVLIERKYQRECQVEGCNAVDDEYQTESDRVDNRDLEDKLNELEDYHG